MRYFGESNTRTGAAGSWPLKVVTDDPDKDGWTDMHWYSYIWPYATIRA